MFLVTEYAALIVYCSTYKDPILLGNSFAYSNCDVIQLAIHNQALRLPTISLYRRNDSKSLIIFSGYKSCSSIPKLLDEVL